MTKSLHKHCTFKTVLESVDLVRRWRLATYQFNTIINAKSNKNVSSSKTNSDDDEILTERISVRTKSYQDGIHQS